MLSSSLSIAEGDSKEYYEYCSVLCTNGGYSAPKSPENCASTVHWVDIFAKTLPETNSSHLKIDLWKRRFLLETNIFLGAMVNFR